MLPQKAQNIRPTPDPIVELAGCGKIFGFGFLKYCGVVVVVS